MKIIRNSLTRLLHMIIRHTFLITLVYKLLIDYMYVHHISKLYAYILGNISPNYNKYAIGWIILAIFVYMSNKINNTDLRLASNFFMTISIIPTITIYWVRDTNTTAFVLIMFFWIVFILFALLISFSKQGSEQMFENADLMPSFNNPIVKLCFCFLIISTVYFSFKYGNFRVFVNFADVYDIRLNQTQSMGRIEGYLYSWNTNLLLPICIISHLYGKKRVLFAIDILIGLLSYSIYGNKFVVFQLLYIIGIWAVSRVNLIELTGSVVTTVISIASLVSMLLKDSIIGRWGVALLYRLLFIPAEAHNYYYDFFQNNELLYLRQSILRRFFDDPYSNVVSIIIGSSRKYNLTGNYNNLNNGLFSDAYANFGVVGTFVYPIIICIFIFYYSKKMKDYNSVFRFVIIISYLAHIISTSLFQSLLTGGLILGAILVRQIRKTSTDYLKTYISE